MPEPELSLFTSLTAFQSDFLLTYYISVIHKSELLSQMLGFYRTLEFITSIAVVCDIWTDVWGRWTTVLLDLFVITERPFARI